MINNRGKNNTSPSRDTISGFWPAEQVLEAGYAMAAFHVSDAAPDDPDAFQNGALKSFRKRLKWFKVIQPCHVPEIQLIGGVRVRVVQQRGVQHS